MHEDGHEAELEAQVRRGLAALATAAPNLPGRLDQLEEQAAALRERHDSRRRFVLTGAATAAAAAAGVWVVRRDDGPRGERVTSGPSETPTGQSEWSKVPPAPLSLRRAPAVVWADTALIVWSGTGAEDYLHPPDGATWRPGSAAWEPIAEAPAGAIGGGFALWDGSEMFVGLTEGDASAPWNDQGSEAQGLYGIAAYSLETDAWRYLAPVPADADERLASRRQAVLTPDGLVVAVRSALPGASGHDRDVSLVNTATGATTNLPPGPFAESPYSDSSGDVSLATIGDLVVAVPNWDRRPWVLDTRSQSWRQADGPPAASSLHLLPPIAAGPRAFLLESSAPGAWLFDPSAPGPDAWTAVAPVPDARAQWRYDPVWSGTEIFIPGHAYNPTQDAWRTIEPPPRGKNRQRTLQARWASDSLLLFGGEEHDCPDDASCDRSPGYDDLDGWTLQNP